MSVQIYVDNRLREFWDDATRTYKTFDTVGTQTSSRAYTAAENTVADAQAADRAIQVNRMTLEEQAAQALAGNRAFLAIASPSNAQVLAQTKALTRQNNGIIRLLLNLNDGTD